MSQNKMHVRRLATTPPPTPQVSEQPRGVIQVVCGRLVGPDGTNLKNLIHLNVQGEWGDNPSPIDFLEMQGYLLEAAHQCGMRAVQAAMQPLQEEPKASVLVADATGNILGLS